LNACGDGAAHISTKSGATPSFCHVMFEAAFDLLIDHRSETRAPKSVILFARRVVT